MQRTFIQCEFCGQQISRSNYSKHVARHQNHPETFKEVYKVDHDDLFCKFCGKECKNLNSLTQHEIRCKENPNRISVIGSFGSYDRRGHAAWNKGLTKDTDERVRRGGETFHQRALAGCYGDKFSVNNPSKREDVRQKISATCLRKSQNGQWHTSLARKMHILYAGEDLHGSWELKYAQYLDQNDISWIRCKDRFEYVFEDKIHFYTPDFYLCSQDCYVEIKGYQTEKDIEKWKQFPKDKNLIVLKEHDLRNLGIKL